jgi:threonine dehydratase
VTDPDVLAAAHRLTGLVRCTDVLASDRLDALVGARVFLKAEHRQVTGSFKARGALNAMLRLDVARGVIAGSSGNHGKALATAAHLLGTTATVVLPDDAPTAKRRAIEQAGATVVPFDRSAWDRDELTAKLAEQHDKVIIPSSDNPDVLAGNGSAAVELLSQTEGLDAVVVPIGGGGLAAGTCLAVRALCPRIPVYAVEPADANDTFHSLRTGRRTTIPTPNTIADGLRHRTPGTVTFPILRRALRDVLLVTDADITAAMRVLRDCIGDRIEPSGACALAALLAHPATFRGQRLGVLVTGGNIDPTLFATLTARRVA